MRHSTLSILQGLSHRLCLLHDKVSYEVVTHSANVQGRADAIFSKAPPSFRIAVRPTSDEEREREQEEGENKKARGKGNYRGAIRLAMMLQRERAPRPFLYGDRMHHRIERSLLWAEIPKSSVFGGRT